MKKAAFTLIEVVITIALLSIIAYIFIPKTTTNTLDMATDRLVLYLKQTRFQSFIKDNYSLDDTLWHKKRWTLKFFRCRKSVGGLYYVIYSDKNRTGHPSAEESLKDPLTQKPIFSTNSCEEKSNYNKYVLLTKEYGIKSVELSCNSTTSLGQLSFSNNGKVYSKLSSRENGFNEYEIKTPCIIRITHNNGAYKEIVVESKTGYIYKR